MNPQPARAPPRSIGLLRDGRAATPAGGTEMACVIAMAFRYSSGSERGRGLQVGLQLVARRLERAVRRGGALLHERELRADDRLEGRAGARVPGGRVVRGVVRGLRVVRL